MVTVRDHVQLLDLNDDVLELILRKLNIFLQFEMAKLHPRFRNIVQTLWRTRVRQVVLYPDMFTYDNNHDFPDDVDFIEFIRALLPHMHRLMMHQMDVTKLRLLDEQRFELITAFEWVGSVQAEETKENRAVPLFMDEDVQLLQRIFPNLRTLKLRTCQVTGKYLSSFPLLRKLSLDDCQYLESDYFREIFQNLRLKKFDIMEDCDEVNCCDLVDLKKCPTLEHIKIADYHLCFEVNIVNDILRMPALRKLSIYSKNFVFDVIERMSRNSIKTIEAFKFTGVLHNFSRFFGEIGNMRHLRKLSIYSCRGYPDIEGIRDHMLLEVAKKLPELEELHFCACDMESYMGLINFVQHCRALRLINVTKSKNIGDKLIWRCIELLKKQTWRTTPLEIWIKNSDIDNGIKANPRYIPNEKLLKINTTNMTHDTSLSGVLKFTFEQD